MPYTSPIWKWQESRFFIIDVSTTFNALRLPHFILLKWIVFEIWECRNVVRHLENNRSSWKVNIFGDLDPVEIRSRTGKNHLQTEEDISLQFHLKSFQFCYFAARRGFWSPGGSQLRFHCVPSHSPLSHRSLFCSGSFACFMYGNDVDSNNYLLISDLTWFN